MILQEGIKVRIGGDAQGLVNALKKGKAEAKLFATAVGAAIAAVTAQSVAMAVELDHQLRLVATLYQGTTEDVKAMRKEVAALNKQYGVGNRQIAQAYYQTVSGGIKKGADATKVLDAAMKLARATGSGLETTIDALVKTMRAYDQEADQAAKTTAQLWAITRDGIVNMEQLGKFLKDLPSAASASDISLAELGGTVSFLTVHLGSVEKAMESLRQLLVQTSVRGIRGSIAERVERLAEISRGGEMTLLKDQIGEINAAMAAQQLIVKEDLFIQGIDRAKKSVQDFEHANVLMATSVKSQWQAIKGQVENVKVALGAGLMDAAVGGLSLMQRLGLAPVAAGGERAQASRARRTGLDVGLRNQGGVVPVRGMEPVPVIIEGVRPGLGFVDDPNSAQARNERLFLGYGMGQLGADPRIPPNQGYNQRNPQFGPWPEGQSPTDRAFSFEPVLADAAEEVTVGMNIASNAALSLAGTVGGELTSALDEAGGGVGRFIGQLLQMAAGIGLRSVFGIGGFRRGGFTGNLHPSSIAGVVHGGEYVVPHQAVQRIGRHNLDSMVSSGSRVDVGGINVNVTSAGPDPNRIGMASARGVGAAMRNLKTTGASRLHASANLG